MTDDLWLLASKAKPIVAPDIPRELRGISARALSDIQAFAQLEGREKVVERLVNLHRIGSLVCSMPSRAAGAAREERNLPGLSQMILKKPSAVIRSTFIFV